MAFLQMLVITIRPLVGLHLLTPVASTDTRGCSTGALCPWWLVVVSNGCCEFTITKVTCGCAVKKLNKIKQELPTEAQVDAQRYSLPCALSHVIPLLFYQEK